MFVADDDVRLQSSKMKEKNKRNMISFHSLLFLFLMKKKKIDSHHADHNKNNKNKKKNTSDAMTSINRYQQEEQ